MKTKSKLIWLAIALFALFIDWEIILPRFEAIMGWFVLGLFAFMAPIILVVFIVRSFFVKTPKEAENK